MKLFILIAALLLTACETLNFQQQALDIRWQMTYEEHSPQVAEWEPLTKAKGYVGDCSNLAATIQKAFPNAIIYKGQLHDGRWHAMACLKNKCVDTLHANMFTYHPSIWKNEPYIYRALYRKDGLPFVCFSTLSN